MNMQISSYRPPKTPRIAVLLNGNAKRVTPRLVEHIAQAIPREDIFYSRTLEEAQAFCQEMYQKQYDYIFTGGGDGTLQQCITQLQQCQQREGKQRTLPTFGVLHLGTGNAVASTLGANPKVLSDLMQAKKNEEMIVRPQHWVKVQDTLAPFAGVGYDSLVINQYKEFNKATATTPFAWAGRGGIGYFLTLAFRSIPAAIFRKRAEVEIINEGNTAYLLGSDGRYVKEFAPGETLYSGPTTIVGASTIPCFGFHFQMYPFATSGDKMQLRVASSSALEAVFNLPALWRGTYRSPSIFDFHATRVRVRFAKPEPLQIGGDAAGCHDEVTFSLSETATHLLDFHREQPRPALSARFPTPKPAR